MPPLPESILNTLKTSNARLTSISSHLCRQPKYRVVVSRNLGPEVMPILEGRAKDIELIVWPEDRVCPRNWLLENVEGATGILVMITDKVDVELLNKAGSSLRVVSTMSVGYEHIDVKELARRDIKLGYTPDILTDAVADISVMLALMAGRNVRATMDIVHSSKWPSSPWAPYLFCGPQLSTIQSSPLVPTIPPTRTAGFLGFGRIAQATLARLIPFGITNCIYNTRSPLDIGQHSERDTSLAARFGIQSIIRVDLESLAKQSDILFILVPGGQETYHLINSSFLKKMKRTAVLVNTARGTIVDSHALAEALREGWIWGAGVDVVEGEPKVDGEHVLVKEPRCVVLPHIGSATLETRIGMATLAAKNLVAGLDEQKMPAGLNMQL